MSRGPEFSFLRSLPLFSAIGDNTLATMAQALTKKKFRAGEHIFYQEETVEHLHIIEMGTVEIYKSDINGKKLTLWHVEGGDAFCLATLFAGGSFANAQALTDCLTFRLSRKSLVALLTQHSDLAVQFITCLSSKLASYSLLLEDFTFRNVQSRLIKILLTDGHRPGNGQKSPCFRLSQGELASRLGTCREVVSRTLTKLRNEGCIETQASGKSSRIVVMDEAKLKRLVDAE